jgi:hypothetical protein
MLRILRFLNFNDLQNTSLAGVQKRTSGILGAMMTLRRNLLLHMQQKVVGVLAEVSLARPEPVSPQFQLDVLQQLARSAA